MNEPGIPLMTATSSRRKLRVNTTSLKILAKPVLTLGLLLLATNLYGLSQTLRPEGLTPEVLRFGTHDLLMKEEELTAALPRRPGEDAETYLKRLPDTIADGIAHIHWLRYPPHRFHQRVPIWENYILFRLQTGIILTNTIHS